MHVRVRVSIAFATAAILFGSMAGVSGPAAAATAGDVVSAQPISVYLAPGRLLKVPARAWKLSYYSTSAMGARNLVSGTLLVPKRSYNGTRPIIGYAMGTKGLGDQCAPSRLMQKGTDVELALVSLLLARNFAVAVTDYEGLGTPGVHTYMAGVSQGHAVLDSIRAAARVPGAGLSPGAPVGVMGYSQGGASAGWAAQLQPAYAPELKLRGVAAGGVPADLQRLADHLDGTRDFGLAAAAGIGLDAAYPELRLTNHLTAEGRTLFAAAANDCRDAITDRLENRTLAELTTTDVLNLPAWQARLAQNRLGSIAPKVPVYLYHARGDQIIPLSTAGTLKSAWCAKGARVLWTPLPAPNHIMGAAAGAPIAVQWLAHRMQGLPTISNC